MKTPPQEGLNFVAIDFETANASRSSPCAIGISVVEGGVVSLTRQWLIRPPDMRFDPFNISIHGITPAMVKNEPEFDELWPELLPFLTRHPIVAHNASFDMSVLRKTLDLYGLKYPTVSYVCSVILAKTTWPGLMSYRLDYLAGHLGFELKHHDAASDASGAANIVKASAAIHTAGTLPYLIEAVKIRIGNITDGRYEPCRLPEGCRYGRQSRPRNERIVLSRIGPTAGVIAADHPLAGKHVVFTGKLQTMERAVAAQEVVDRGGSCGENINSETDYLVVGSFNAASLREGGKSSKLRKAEQLASAGQPIEIIGEEDFLRLL